MTTTLRTHGHACVRLERDGRALVVDPGVFSDPTAVDGADAVLVTHGHADHVVPDRLVAVLDSRPGLHVWAPADVVDRLRQAGAGGDRVRAVDGGDAFEAAGFAVRVLGHDHAPIHPDVPTGANVAYLLDGAVLHPGDSFTAPADGTAVQVLLLPISAPWSKTGEVGDYARRVGPAVAVPVHDAVLSDVGRELYDRVVRGLAEGVDYRRLGPDDVLTVGS